jgi:hypothetical protein
MRSTHGFLLLSLENLEIETVETPSAKEDVFRHQG